MNEIDGLLERINLLEYHQKLLLQLLINPNLAFYKLIIEKGLTEKEVKDFFQLCDKMSIQLEEQKAEGYVYFHPLFNEFADSLPGNLSVNEAIMACLTQNLYEFLFQELKKYI